MHDKIIIFSGAGLSASSGIETFRADDGLWAKHDIKDICTAGCLDWNYENTINFYNNRRLDIEDKKPNKAHEMISKLKTKYPNKIEVITQNIDDLLERAKCKDILHLHGFLKELRCMKCDEIIDIEYRVQKEEKCSCGGSFRPNIVFFGEAAPKYEEMHDILDNNCCLLVVIGTSGNVIDVNYLTQYSDISILNNLEASNVIDESYFEKIYYEDAATAYVKIEKDIENFIKDGKI